MALFRRKKVGRTLRTKARYRTSLENKSTRKRKPITKTTEKKLLKSKPTRKKLKKAIRPAILIGAGLIIYLVAYFFFLSPVFTITNINFDHNEITVEDENPILAYVKNFEGENIFLTRTEEEEDYLRSVYPEYKTIEIKKSPPKTLILKLELYELKANLISENEGFSRKFIVNEKGIATSADTEDPALPYIYIETPDIIVEGKEAISDAELAFALEAMTDFENKFGMQVLDATFYKTAREVHLQTERYFDVWLDAQSTVDEQLNKLKQALPKLNIYETDLEYIDLRISGQSGDKVIYMPS